MSASDPHRSGAHFSVGDPAPDPLPLRTESEIMATWHGHEPVVSVTCSTYQHVGFIEDALQGILGQRTSFPFELLVRDDASTDGTTEVVADFADRYPQIVRAILEPVNRWRTPGPRLRELARGSYLARCEGDDYWIDPDKLQRQVETLEADPGAVLSHHQAIVIRDERIIEAERLPPDHRRDYRPDELMRAPLLVTATVLTRNLPLDEHPRREQILNRDMFLAAQFGEHGSARYEPDLLPAVHRHHPGGVWSARDAVDRGIDSARSYYWIGHYFAERDPEVATSHFARGLSWYLRGARDAGVDPVELLARQERALGMLLRRPKDVLPETVRRLVDDRDRAREQLAVATEMHDRLRRRRGVRAVLGIARLASPILARIRRRLGRGDAG